MDMLNFEAFHTLGFFHGSIPEVDNTKFKKHILKTKTPYKKDEHFNRYEDTQFPMCKEFGQVLDHVRQNYYEVTRKKVELVNFWSHIHQTNMSTSTHAHITDNDFESARHITEVYYVAVPKGSGDFVIVYPYNRFVIREKHLTPQDGKFILFSSAFEHYVTRNMSRQPRISVSFNFKLLDD